MIAETPKTLLILLAALTLLGALIGYCLALIIAKKQAKAVIDAVGEDFESSQSNMKAELASLQAKHERLTRDFASYKTSKHRELELARQSTGFDDSLDSVPTLRRRVEGAQLQAGSDVARRVGASSRGANNPKKSAPLSKRISRELEIPALAESELPESLDDLEFEMEGAGGSWAKTRG